MKTAEEILHQTADKMGYEITTVVRPRVAIAAMEAYAAQFKTRWIPVEESLPEKSEYYLVAYIDTYLGQQVHIGWKYFSSDYNWWSSSYKITHWQPLPELPGK